MTAAHHRLLKSVSCALETICATWTEAKQLPEVLIIDNNIKRLRVRFLPRHAIAVSLARLRWNETQRVINILCLPETQGLLPGYAEIKLPRRSPSRRLQEVSFQQFNKSPSVRPENVFNFAAEKESSPLLIYFKRLEVSHQNSQQSSHTCAMCWAMKEPRREDQTALRFQQHFI